METIEIKDLPDADAIRILMEGFGLTEEDARMALAIERGEIDGDVITNA